MSVFLSHSSKNKEFARRLRSDLEREGIKVWLDEAELRVGEDLSVIDSRIRESKFIVVVMSAAAARSPWIERELGVARSINEIEILPVLLEDGPGRWEGGLAEKAIADFRNPAEYWRSLHRLAHAITGELNLRLSARKAAEKVKVEMNPSGELFGLSQQGVAISYCLANAEDWVFANALSGASRLWVVEFYDSERSRIQAYSVVNNSIHELPDLFPLGPGQEPESDSVIVYSCALGPGIPEQKAQALIEQEAANFRRIEKRYTRFNPLPFHRSFVDSDVAVSRAIECGQERSIFKGSEEIFALTKLECDKRYGGFQIWKVAFFDPALLESVLTVGIDAVTGAVKFPAMQAEILNARLFQPKVKGGNIVIGLGHQLKIISKSLEDDYWSRELAGVGLTAREALRLADDFLGSDLERKWRFAFLSNTGVVASVVSPSLGGPENGLMKPDGTAGQWVIEVYSGEPRLVSDGSRTGYEYDFKQVWVTRKNGAVSAGSRSTWIFTVPFSRCPLPHGLLDAYEKARALALRSAAADFRVMSVAMNRRESGAEWYFRFYDSENLLLTLKISGDGTRVIA